MTARSQLVALASLAVGLAVACTTVLPPPSPTASAAVTPSPSAPSPAPATSAPTPLVTEAPTDAPASSEPTPSPTPSPTPPPTPIPPVTVWTGPIVVSDNHYQEISLVVDDSGRVHAAGSLDRSIWYVTNRRGNWTRERLSDPPGSGSSARTDIEPAIARDEDRFWVAFTRLGEEDTFGALPEHVYHLSGRANNWSDPQQYGPIFGNSPSIQVRNGNIHLAYLEGVPFDVVEDDAEFPLRYATDQSGTWSDVVVSVNGTEPTLQLTSGGRARIAFGDFINLLPGDGLRYASAGSATGDFSVEMVPGTSGLDFPHSMSLDGEDGAHLVWGLEDGVGVHYAMRGAGGWSPPQALMNDGSVASIASAVDGNGALHVVATTVSHGAWYFTNRHGAFESRELLPPPSTGNWFRGSCDIAVDPSGRAHMLFIVGRNAGSTRLWYAASPAV